MSDIILFAKFKRILIKWETNKIYKDEYSDSHCLRVSFLFEILEEQFIRKNWIFQGRWILMRRAKVVIDWKSPDAVFDEILELQWITISSPLAPVLLKYYVPSNWKFFTGTQHCLKSIAFFYLLQKYWNTESILRNAFFIRTHS